MLAGRAGGKVKSGLHIQGGRETISSAHGAEPTRPSYAMSKAGVNALMRHVAARWGKEGLTANVLAPGFTHRRDEGANRRECFGIGEVGEQFPWRIRRTLAWANQGHAGGVAPLLSADGRWINDSIIDMNGGSLMRA